MIFRIYKWFHRLASQPDERGKYSSGYWQDSIRKTALELCKTARGKLVEIGCGEGLFLIQLALAYPDLEIWGVDNDARRLEELKKSCSQKGIRNIRVLLQDATGLKLDDGAFNTVVCINVMQAMRTTDMTRAAMKEMSRVCARGGRIVLEFRNARNLLLKAKYALAPFYDHTMRGMTLTTYEPSLVEEVLKDVGFRVIDEKYPSFPRGRRSPIIIMLAEKE